MAAVEFYIQNFLYNGSIVTTETKFQEIPLDGAPVINEPKVKCEMGKSGSFEFSMEMTSPYYNSMMQMKTIMRVVLFGNTIFRGRVITIDKTMERKRSVHCEGSLSFFLDSHQIGTKEEARKEISVLEYLQQIIEQHNTDMADEPIKQFTLGEVPGQYTNATEASQRVNIPDEKAKQQFGDTGWNSSMDRLEGLLNDFGGYFRVRYDVQTGVNYLDWFDKYYNSTPNTQTIEVAKNLIDVSGSTEVENLFTILIPMGKKDSKDIFITDYWPIVDENHAKVNYIMVPELATIPLYTDAELNSNYHSKSDYLDAINRYGKIWKPLTFDNANTPEKLFAYAKDWIKNNYSPELTQWSVSALDMKFVDSSNQVLLCGDRVILIHPEVGQQYGGLTVISAEYDLYNPDKNKYTIGVPNQQLNASYGVKNKSKGSKGGISGGGGGGGEKLPTPEEEMHERLSQLYWDKALYDRDTGYDAPGAYAIYKPDGTKKETKEVAKDVLKASRKFLELLHSDKLPEIEARAKELGTTVRDVRVLLEFCPEEKEKDDKFRFDSEEYWVEHYNITHQQAAYILNNNPESWLASLVDDNGNWSKSALSRQVTLWRNAKDLKQQAINVRKALRGDKSAVKSEYSYFSSYTPVAISGDMNVGNYVTTSIDEVTKLFGIGDSSEGGSGMAAVIETGKKVIEQGKEELSKVVKFNDGNVELGEKTTELVDQGVTLFDDTFGFSVRGKDGTKTSVISGNNTEDGNTEVSVKSSTVDIDGNTDGGSVQLGGIEHKGVLNGWDVAINKQITYTAKDSEGHTHTYRVPAKSLAADDLHFTATYDSLRAKLLVVDTLLADYAQIGTLEALKARIDDITGNTIVADTYIRSDKMYCNRLTANSYISSPSYTLSGVGDGGGDIAYLQNCLSECTISESGGVITFDFYKIGGGKLPSKNFNMAATQFYLDAVAAAHDDGGETAYFTASRTGNLDPGQSSTIYAYYVDHSGTAKRSSVSATGKYSSLTLQARNLRLRTPGAAVIPTTSNQTILPGSDSGGTAYDGLAQVVVAGDANLVASKIKSGVSIFGVSGTYKDSLSELTIWDGSDNKWSGNKDLTGEVTLTPYVKVNGSWSDVVGESVTITPKTTKSGVSCTRGSRSLTEPSTDNKIARITANGWYVLTIDVLNVTKTYRVEIDVP